MDTKSMDFGDERDWLALSRNSLFRSLVLHTFLFCVNGIVVGDESEE